MWGSSLTFSAEGGGSGAEELSLKQEKGTSPGSFTSEYRAEWRASHSSGKNFSRSESILTSEAVTKKLLDSICASMMLGSSNGIVPIGPLCSGVEKWGSSQHTAWDRESVWSKSGWGQ